jgi:hypothetical protein
MVFIFPWHLGGVKPMASGVDFGQVGKEGGAVQLRKLRRKYSRGRQEVGGVLGDEEVMFSTTLVEVPIVAGTFQ